MAEITHVDLDHLHRLAALADDTAEQLRTFACPRLEPTALPGSAVEPAASPETVARRIDEVAAGLRDWADAARAAATAFVGTDRTNGARFRGP